MPRIPLGYIHVLLIINTNVMGILKYFYGLMHLFRFISGIGGSFPARFDTTLKSLSRMVTKPDCSFR